MFPVFSPEKREEPDRCAIDSKGPELCDQGGIGNNDFQQADFGSGINTGEKNGCGDKSQQDTQIYVNCTFNGLFNNDSQQDRIFK